MLVVVSVVVPVVKLDVSDMLLVDVWVEVAFVPVDALVVVVEVVVETDEVKVAVVDVAVDV